MALTCCWHVFVVGPCLVGVVYVDVFPLVRCGYMLCRLMLLAIVLLLHVLCAIQVVLSPAGAVFIGHASLLLACFVHVV